MNRKEANVKGSYQVLIDAPIDTVWHALAVDYGGIGKWASGVNHVVEFSGEGVNAQRYCEISAAGFNDTRERMLKFEPENYYFEYELYEGLPGFVKYSINKDRLEEKDGKTLWISENEMRVGGIMGLTMKGFMSKKLGQVLEAKGQELKHFIETGRQHPNKLAAIAKQEKKKLFVLEKTIQAPVYDVWKVIAEDFDKVSDSHPVSPKSEFTDSSSQIKVGSKRIMYMSQNLKKYFIDEVIKLDEDKYNILLNVVEAKGYPISFSNVEFITDSVDADAAKLTMIFSYQTKPRFLQGLAKGSLKRQLQDYMDAIDHHVTTGEVITSTNWKQIRKKYK